MKEEEEQEEECSKAKSEAVLERRGEGDIYKGREYRDSDWEVKRERISAACIPGIDSRAAFP